MDAARAGLRGVALLQRAEGRGKAKQGIPESCADAGGDAVEAGREQRREERRKNSDPDTAMASAPQGPGGARVTVAVVTA